MNYPKIIAAISGELQRRYAIVDTPQAGAGDVVGKMLASHAAMPDYLRLAIRVLAFIFDFTGFVTSGIRFRNMSPELQAQQMDAWKSSRFNLCRDFVRFHEKLFLLIVMEEESR